MKLRTWNIVILVFLLSFTVRISYMNDGLFHHDSVRLAEAVEDTLAGDFHGQINGRYGSVLINLVIYAPLQFLGINAEFSTIFTNILFSSLSVVLIFLLGNYWFSRRAGVYTALLFSFSSLFLTTSTVAKPTGLELFFILLAFVLLHEYWKRKKLFWLLFSGISIGFAPLVRESALIFVPLYFLYVLSPRITIKGLSLSHEKFHNLCWSLFGFIIPFGIGLFSYLGEVLYGTLFSTSRISIKFLSFFSPTLAVALNDLYSSLGLFTIIFVAIGLFLSYYKKDNYFFPIFMILWCMTIFYYGNTSGYTARYLVITSFPFYLLAGLALSKIKWGVVAQIIVCVLMILSFYNVKDLLSFRANYSGPKEYALWVKKQVPSKSIIIAMDESPFFEYYGELETLLHPVDDKKKIDTWIIELRQLIRLGRPVYLVESGLAYDDNFILRPALFSSFRLIPVGSKLTEDYHRPELKTTAYAQKLARLEPIE